VTTATTANSVTQVAFSPLVYKYRKWKFPTSIHDARRAGRLQQTAEHAPNITRKHRMQASTDMTLRPDPYFCRTVDCVPKTGRVSQRDSALTSNPHAPDP
jgi:hypothetical protein